ncbi:hypothetical protein EYW49_17545 [Siculibacillus lacustris]|uniref:Uncharacterized protein n=1 Tax=Siculibacillus lacustris TaxID=1549641 RepID=A0A4Q9VI23_9HYPH|nr:hypothetical protein [Siculibacillus lacustris]TBW34725.1 hypothetical protein EYW49_17545 [Siculibacillus lacustris]
MARATPAEYLRNYHGMYFMDLTLERAILIDMRLYVSGSDLHPDFGRVMQAVLPFCTAGSSTGSASLQLDPAKVGALLAKTGGSLGAAQVDTEGTWSVPSLKRAYMGRGSPQEVFDATRLAIYAGVTNLTDASTYITKTFGQDCNAFVGNYLGLSPMIGIGYYCEKWRPPNEGGETGAAGKVSVCPPIGDVARIETGDIFVVYGDRDARGLPYRHIGLVGSFTPGAPRPVAAKPGAKPGTPAPPPVVSSGMLSKVEWGAAGGWDTHCSAETPIEFVVGTRAPWPPGEPAVYSPITDEKLQAIYGKTARLYFLSTAAIRAAYQPRTSQIAGRTDL